MNRRMLMIVLMLMPASMLADVLAGDWQPVFRGVDHATGTNLPSAARPWLQVVHALRVDLADPAVRLFTSPQTTPYDPEASETAGNTASGFLSTYGLQASINANFFSLYGTRAVGAPQEIYGLAICTGQVVSALEPVLPTYFITPCAFLFTPQNQATAVLDNLAAWTNLDGFATAVTGSYPLLVQGLNVASSYLNIWWERIHSLNPRTAMGLSQDRRYLFLLTIDGRQSGYSDGAFDWETAEWLRQFGAWDGINLDGGGSSEMVVADSQGAPVILNRPSDGQERVVGHCFGLSAQPLAPLLQLVEVNPASHWAVLTWSTPVPTTARLEYGAITDSDFISQSSTPRTRQSMVLPGLQPETTYYYRAIVTADARTSVVTGSFETSATPDGAPDPAPVPPTSRLTWLRTVSGLNLDWEVVGLKLQQADELQGPWADVPGPVLAGPYPVEIETPTRFYRLSF